VLRGAAEVARADEDELCPTSIGRFDGMDTDDRPILVGGGGW
jgi:hypothetical protein